MNDQATFRRGKRIAVKADVRISVSEDVFAEATVHDISRYGLSIDGLQHFSPEAVLDVTFANGQAVTGRAVWNEDFLDGIKFEPPLGAEEFANLLVALKVAA